MGWDATGVGGMAGWRDDACEGGGISHIAHMVNALGSSFAPSPSPSTARTCSRGVRYAASTCSGRGG